MTAARAREISAEAESISSEHARQETQAVLIQIEKHAKEAKRSCTPVISVLHRKVIEKRLKDLGYTVVYHAGDYRENGYHTVSW